MIKVENVKKQFIKYDKKKIKEKFYAVDDISFEVKSGEILGILGPNGAGKTTLLRMVAGIMEPTEGSVSYDKLNFKDNEIEIKKQLSYLSGNTHLYKSLSAYELLSMCCNFYEIGEEEKEKRIKELSKTLKLEKFLHNRIGNLSTGQTQKVNIARCFIHNPNYYILDEVTSGLDIISRQIILDFIRQEKENGKCVLYSTHYMEEAESICDRVVMVNRGKIIKIGTPEEIKRETKTNNLRDAFFALIGGSYEE